MSDKKEMIDRELSKILDLKLENISLGHGSFLTLDFGEKIKIRKDSDLMRGEWHLWIYMCSWRIVKEGLILTASNDSQESICRKIQELTQLKLIDFEIVNEFLDVNLLFEKHITISLFNCSTEEDSEHWMLFTPDYHALTVGPANKISYGLSENPIE